MRKIISATKMLPVIYTAVLSTSFLLSIALLDTIMKRKIPLCTRDAISHFVIIAA